MEANILTVGDEILIGQIENTNASWISRHLTQLGLRVSAHFTAPDERTALVSLLRTLVDDKAGKLLILTGGLGPTHDDITMQAVSEALGLELVLDESWVKVMEGIFTARGRKMSEHNIKQAMLPAGAIRIDNDCGTAPGAWLEIGKCKIAILPGVPYEMQSMMNRFVLPRMTGVASITSTYQRNLFATGIGESAMAAKVDALGIPISKLLASDVSLAWLPTPSQIRLRITSKDKNRIAQVESHLMKAIAPFVFGTTWGFDEIALEQVVGDLLKSKSKTVSLAESCTGGLLSNKLTNVSGSSGYFIGSICAYSNNVKVKELGVDPKLLDMYGAVSEQVASAMATGALEKFGTDYSVAITGIAGPDGGTPDKPVGTVWIALASRQSDGIKITTLKNLFETDRLRNKERSAQTALNMLRQAMLG